jgi:hypothetical protein
MLFSEDALIYVPIPPFHNKSTLAFKLFEYKFKPSSSIARRWKSAVSDKNFLLLTIGNINELVFYERLKINENNYSVFNNET